MIIVKHKPGKKFNPLYLIESNETQPLGVLSHEAIELLKEKGYLVSIEQTEVIEKHFESIELIKDVSICEYYQLIIGDAIVSLVEQFNM